MCVLCVRKLRNMSAGAQGSQRYWIPWSWLTWALGSELESFGITACAISPANNMLPTLKLPNSAVEGS